MSAYINKTYNCINAYIKTCIWEITNNEINMY